MVYSARPAQPSLHTAIGGAAFGTFLGAAAGTAIGGAARSPGAGAAIGSAAGFVSGSAVAAKDATASELQKRYNIAYTQCMYALGNGVQAAPPAR
ncbi:MAG: glycine zipper family protein, partial [Acetobacteraceae bacterium]|nr:glycine zipper family protein [Acetobacteraceae bacterium]